jgi:hypothetical protein
MNYHDDEMESTTAKGILYTVGGIGIIADLVLTVLMTVFWGVGGFLLGLFIGGPIVMTLSLWIGMALAAPFEVAAERRATRAARLSR